jgi:hypothetical protein
MREGRSAWLSLSLSIIAAVQLSLIPVSNAQTAPAQGEPEVNDQGNDVAPPPPPPGPPGPPPVSGPVVRLRANSPKARLQLMDHQLQWRDVCVAPCRVPVNPQGTYRIGGGTIRASDSFTMPRPSGQVVIDAQVGSKIKHWVGIALIIGGVVDGAFGTIYYATASDLASSSSNTTGLGKGYFQTVGIVGIVTGLILLGVGIPLSASSTSVEIH